MGPRGQAQLLRSALLSSFFRAKSDRAIVEFWPWRCTFVLLPGQAGQARDIDPDLQKNTGSDTRVIMKPDMKKTIVPDMDDHKTRDRRGQGRCVRCEVGHHIRHGKDHWVQQERFSDMRKNTESITGTTSDMKKKTTVRHRKDHIVRHGRIIEIDMGRIMY